MNLRQIEAFRAVMVTGSVSGAARLLHVSVPAISRLLSHTESRLGFALFERVKGRLHPTAEARRLYLEVEQVYGGVQRIGSLTRELAVRRRGLVSILSSPSLGQMIVPLAIAQLRTALPDLQVHFHCLNHDALKERILQQRADLGISTFPVDHPNLVTRPLAAARLLCICPHSHPLATYEEVGTEELLPHELIGYPHGSPLGMRIDQMFAAGDAAPRFNVEVTSPHYACALVHAGAGAALVDEYSLQGWLESRFKVIPVRGAQPIVADLVHLQSEPLSPAAHALLRALHSVLLQCGLALPFMDDGAPG
ncbi:LysR family transcriptional regulator [Paracidovorax avenae]|uniref:LysR family transcriptional regulator n=1 Tax=Paracidovorax avenae TaxID=80867 RepID=UPI000D160F98|nr:LysR family transcriptional regulator [Paracidovorax avenae]AVS69788.1 LysR family transcriptional regulator [Paracidovorax avenae]